MFTAVLFLAVGYHTIFSACVNAEVYADDNVKRYWCLGIQEHLTKEGCTYEQRGINTASILIKGNHVLINDKDLNQTILCDSSAVHAECARASTAGNIWRSIYQVIIISSVFVLSVLSEKLAGSKTHTCDVFKRRNRFIEEIEAIKRWGKSMKPNVIVEQGWKIDWTSDIWLEMITMLKLRLVY